LALKVAFDLPSSVHALVAMLQGVLVACLALASVAQDLFLAPVVADKPATSLPKSANRCPPKEWILQMYSGGHWILDYTDSSWDAYMQFLGLAESAWPIERNTSDIHEYYISKDGSYFVMNHTIPASKFHLLFKAELGTSSEPPAWSRTPYMMPTPAGFNPHPLKYNMTLWRNFIEEPGKPFPESCYALRTQNRGIYNNSGVLSELVVDFTGELLSPYEWRYSLHVWDWKTGKTIEPWKSQLQNAKPHPGVCYRYFKKAVQSFADAEARHPCQGMLVDGQTYQFC